MKVGRGSFRVRGEGRSPVGLAVAAQWAIVLAAGALYLVARSTDDDRIGVFGFLLVPLGIASLAVLWRVIEDNSQLSRAKRALWLYVTIALIPVGGTLYWLRHVRSDDSGDAASQTDSLL